MTPESTKSLIIIQIEMEREKWVEVGRRRGKEKESKKEKQRERLCEKFKKDHATKTCWNGTHRQKQK